MNKPLFAIGIPTINRADLLAEGLEKLARDYPNVQVFILDNGNQGIRVKHKTHIVIKTPQNFGVAKSWNFLTKEIYEEGYPYALILNDDIVLGNNEGIVNNAIAERGSVCDIAVSPNGWSSFLLPRRTKELVGGFDEKFGNAYFEDNDYHYRMILLGLNYNIWPEINSEIFRNSQTIAKDSYLNLGFDQNKKYYISKWGGEPAHETFKTPFNQ